MIGWAQVYHGTLTSIIHQVNQQKRLCINNDIIVNQLVSNHINSVKLH